MTHDPPGGEGQLYTLGLLEQLRAECRELWGESSNLYHRIDGLLRELANPNLHDIRSNLPAHSDEVGRGFRAKAAACTD